MRHSRRAGFTIIEVALAIAISLVMMGAVIGVYNSVRVSTNMSNARSMVGTIQTNIAMDKFRLGGSPPRTPQPVPSSSAVVSQNLDSNGKPYWPGGIAATVLPNDPILGNNLVLYFDSTMTPVPLVTNDPTDRWDNPVFLSPGAAAAGYGKGGWLYDDVHGSFRINLTNHDYPGDHPGGW
jgi:type II secretory pathway pseudopilin PulG